MTTNLEGGKSNQIRIKELALLIDKLSTKLHQHLTIKFATSSLSNSILSYKSIKNFIFPQKPAPFAIGERVVITNTYQNL